MFFFVQIMIPGDFVDQFSLALDTSQRTMLVIKHYNSSKVVAGGFISFFGLTRTTGNWGTLIYDAFVYANIGASGGGTWHMLIPAALSFSLFALGFYLVSRGLYRVASPIIREERV